MKPLSLISIALLVSGCAVKTGGSMEEDSGADAPPDEVGDLTDTAVPDSWDAPDTSDPPIETDPLPEERVGEPCTDPAACGGGCCIPQVGDVYFADGYCSVVDCTSDSDCPADAFCMPNHYVWVPIDSYCAKRCTSDADCRTPMYACLVTDVGVNGCLPNFW